MTDYWVGWLSELMLPLMRYRIAALGVDGSGAYSFYDRRVADGRVFCEYEVRLVRLIVESSWKLGEVHEIGCGWGQLVFLLAWNGYDATGFEIDRRRYLSAEYFRGILGQIDDQRTGRATVRNEFFPPLRRPDPNNSLVIATNVVSNAQFTEEQMLWGLRRYRYAIVDVDRFCRERGAAERPGWIASAEASGLRNLGPFCDAGSEGQFYLFAGVGLGAAAGPEVVNV